MKLFGKLVIIGCVAITVSAQRSARKKGKKESDSNDCADCADCVKNAPECSGQGTLCNGVCKCDAEYNGPNCECDAYAPWGSSSSCRDRGSCSNRGNCHCGECNCDMRPHPGEFIDGKYCQCTNFLCERHNGLICSGPEQGQCICNHCECKPGWTGPACNCEDSQDNCINPDDGQVCSGNGICKCNKCKCFGTDAGQYSGKWCEDCPTCRGKCDEFKECVQCMVFNTGSFSQEECIRKCYTLTLKLENGPQVNVEVGESMCKFFDEDDCEFSFVYDSSSFIRVPSERFCRPRISVFNYNSGVIEDSEDSLTLAGDLISSVYHFAKEVFNNTFAQFFKDITNHMKRPTPF